MAAQVFNPRGSIFPGLSRLHYIISRFRRLLGVLTVSSVSLLLVGIGCKQSIVPASSHYGARLEQSAATSLAADTGHGLGPVPDGTGPPVRTARSQALAQARGFTRSVSGDTTVLRVLRPWQGSRSVFTYILVPAPAAPPNAGAAGRSSSPAENFLSPVTFISQDSLRVPVPLRRAVTLTTTNLYAFTAFGALDALVGLGGGRFACDSRVTERLRQGRIRDVGDDMHVDAEAVVATRPQAAFTFVVGGASDGGLAKLREAGVPALIDGAYMEATPLGRAEWMKFTAAFLGKSREADSLFAVVDSGYRALAALAAGAVRRPTVLIDAPFGGVWWMPGGRSYVARLLADAGANYLWADDTLRGTLNLDLETVLAKARDADFWLNPGTWRSLSEGRARDPRHAAFRAFQRGEVYNQDHLLCGDGGNDYFQTGAARPDWILADLIALFHPELLPGHVSRWYRKLDEKAPEPSPGPEKKP